SAAIDPAIRAGGLVDGVLERADRARHARVAADIVVHRFRASVEGDGGAVRGMIGDLRPVIVAQREVVAGLELADQPVGLGYGDLRGVLALLGHAVLAAIDDAAVARNLHEIAGAGAVADRARQGDAQRFAVADPGERASRRAHCAGRDDDLARL